jgi:menaquinone-dependent protoporphyrinogen oxidase
MPRILVLFGTTEGQTSKIADALAAAMRQQGAEVDVANAATDDPSPDQYAGVIVAASVHAGGYQQPVRRWVRKHAAALHARESAFVSVCLGVLEHNPETEKELRAIQERFLSAAGWRPGLIKVVAGALPYTKYNWLTRWMMKRIVKKAGGDTDTSRDYEYTDWEDVRRFGTEFVRALDARP